MSVIQPRLYYNYAVLAEDGRCHSVITSSYEVPLSNYILIPSLNDAYQDKYYKDGLWYTDASFSVLADGLN